VLLHIFGKVKGGAGAAAGAGGKDLWAHGIWARGGTLSAAVICDRAQSAQREHIA
jgi:hypothetical protein